MRVAVAGLVAALAAVLWGAMQMPGSFERAAPVASQDSPIRDGVTGKPNGPTGPSAGGSDLEAIARELRDTSNLYAAYQKYDDAPDPTGRISYLLAGWIDDCMSYLHPDLDRYFSATPEMRANAKRKEMMAAVAARCAGFDRNDEVLTDRLNSELYKRLHERARQAGYPGELARLLAPPWNHESPSAKTDQAAIALLSGPIDGEVIKYVAQYLRYRNGPEWPPYGAEGQLIWFSAWNLLECEFGADCGPRSRAVQVNCTHRGYCGMAGIEDALLVQPRMNEQRLSIANELRAELFATIRNRDWVRLGFKPK